MLEFFLLYLRMELFKIYCIFGIAVGILVIITLLLIVCDKNFVGYTRTTPLPPSYLKPKNYVKNKKTSVYKSKSSK